MTVGSRLFQRLACGNAESSDDRHLLRDAVARLVGNQGLHGHLALCELWN